MEHAIGHYRIVRRLGAGGMGEVYEAEDGRLKRRVALKRLPKEVADDPQLRARFQREAEAVAALDHPNIVAIHSIEEAAGDDGKTVRFFTMQLVAGATLEESVPEEGLPPDRWRQLALPLVEALAAVHERGITHRDLKPRNVMVGEDGRLRVLDFGLARRAVDATRETLGTRDQLTVEGALVGTLQYMAPEQLAGRPADTRSDVFALGCLLLEMATGRPAFRGATAAEIISAILRDEPDVEEVVRHGLPSALAPVLGRCLKKQPEERYPEAGALLRELVRLSETAHAGIRSPDVRDSPLPLPSRPSLAALPFRCLSETPEDRDLAYGLWVDLLSDLVKLSGLFLISQLSLERYREREVDAATVARELGVRYVLEGSLRRSGQRVRLNVHLSDTVSGQTAWAERFDRELGDVFDLQDELVGEIVLALDVKLLYGEAVRTMKHHLQDPHARGIYYRALSALFSGQSGQLTDARRLLAQLGELEPDSPMAPVFTAFSHYLEAKLGFSREPEASRQSALECAARALELGDVTGSAHMIRGLVHLHRREHEAALLAAESAVADRPSCPWVYALKGAIKAYSGRPAEALELARIAIRHTPLFPPIFVELLSTSHYLLGQHEEAIEAARGAVSMAPESLEARLVLSASLAASGRMEEARREVAEIERRAPDFSLVDHVRSQPYQDPGVLDPLVTSLQAIGLH